MGCVTVPDSSPNRLVEKAKLAKCVDAENGQAGNLTPTIDVKKEAARER